MNYFSIVEMEAIKTLLTRRLGISLSDPSFYRLDEILADRLKDSAIVQPSTYCSLLMNEDSEASRNEIRILATQLTVGETYFYRHPEHLAAFREMVLPRLIQICGSTRVIRILSAGCASGEEPYTIATIVRESVPDLEEWKISILGIDLNPNMLDLARVGAYSPWALRQIPPDFKNRYFQWDGKKYHLIPSIKSMVTFRECNLAEENEIFWAAETFETIFFRNVSIYFTPETTRKIISRISHALIPGGFLFLGPSETLRGISTDFHLKHTHNTFYYQIKSETQFKPKSKHKTLSRTELDPLQSLQQPPSFQYDTSNLSLESDTSWIEIISRSSERISKLASGLPAPTQNLISSNLLKKAKDFFQQEQYDDASKLLSQYESSSGASRVQDFEALLLQAVILTNQGHVKKAEQKCSQILERDELNAGAHFLKALCREHENDISAAIEQDQTASYLDPNFAMPHLHLGILYRRTDRFKNAQEKLKEAERLLQTEDSSRILLFGGGFNRRSLLQLVEAELVACKKGNHER